MEEFQHHTPTQESEPEAAGHPRYPFIEWHMLVGAVVDVRSEGVSVRTGLVEEATPSGDTASIAADGIDRRIMIQRAAGYDLWTQPNNSCSGGSINHETQ